MEIYIIYAIIILWVCHRLKVIKFSHFKIPDKTIQQIIGDIGEKKVAKELKKLNDEYIIENSIDTEYGIRLSGLQIDHIVRHPKSNTIFVIETKNWGGVITGKNYDNNWKQELDGEEHWFFNPIKQNNAHCNALSRKYPNCNIKSLIVFVNKNSIINNKSPEVIKLNRLIDYINNKNI